MTFRSADAESSSRIKSERVPKGKGCSQNASKKLAESRKLSPNKAIYHERRKKLESLPNQRAAYETLFSFPSSDPALGLS